MIAFLAEATQRSVVGKEISLRMPVLLIVITCALACVFALLRFLLGEVLRKQQSEEARKYLERSQQIIRERLRAEKEKRKQSQESGRRIPEVKEDRELSKAFSFVNKIAKENPELFAKAVRRYVQMDPAVASGKKRATDFEALDSNVV